MSQGPVRRPSRIKSAIKAISALGLGAALVLPATQPAGADAADYMLDLGAAGPYSYNHATGGGAWSDAGTIGRENRSGRAAQRPGLVDSLDRNAFHCGDTISLLELIERTSDLGGHATEAIELEYSFAASADASAGDVIGRVSGVSINYGAIDRFPWGLEASDGGASVDRAIFDDGGSTATLISEAVRGPSAGVRGALVATVRIDDLEINESVVLRIDVILECPAGSDRSGTLLVDRSDEITVISDGVATAQTVPSGADRIALSSSRNR